MNDPMVPGLQIWPSQATSHLGIHALLYSSSLESSLTLQPNMVDVTECGF